MTGQGPYPTAIQPRIGDFLDSLQPLASELGPETALDLVRHFGGTPLYVPAVWRADSRINAIGTERARRLCTLFGPERIDIPRLPWTTTALRRFARDLGRQGLGISDIALSLGVSYRTIERALATGAAVSRQRRARSADDSQIDLVDWLAQDTTRRPTRSA